MKKQTTRYVAQTVVDLFEQYDRTHPYQTDGLLWTNKGLWCDAVEVARFLRVEISTSRMLRWWKSNAVIVLRRYAGEETLVVGCGNDPIMFFGMPMRQELGPVLSMDQETTMGFVENIGYHCTPRHRHMNSYTINPDPGMNPSIIGKLGIDNLHGVLPASAFSSVLFEGMYIPNGENRNAVRTILYTLREGGSVAVDDSSREPSIVMIKRRGRLVTMDGQVVIKNDDDFYKFWKACDWL